MAVRFPEEPLLIDSAESQTGHIYNHLVNVAKESTGQLHGIARGIAIDPITNHIYIVQGGSIYKLSIFSETGEYLNGFSSNHIWEPWGIAIHRDNVYVTNVHDCSISWFKLAGLNIYFVANVKGKRFLKFKNPSQLAVSTNGEVFVTDYSNDRVQILTIDLRYKRHISHHSMTRPSDVKLTADEVYVLSHLDSPCIHVFSNTGKKLRSLITSNGLQVLSPSFFCLNSDGNLFVSDEGGHNVQIFSKRGKLLHTIGGPGKKLGMFMYPQGIALINDFKLVVVSANNKFSIQIFSY